MFTRHLRLNHALSLHDVSNAQLALSRLVDFPSFSFFAMASSGHRDVNLPPATWHRAGGFLAEFGEWLTALGFTTWTVDKEAGNHLTNFWLYSRMDSAAPAKSQVQFGCTQFAAVNAKIHAYARGKGQHLTEAVDLLQHFVSQVWAFDEQAGGYEGLAPANQDDGNWQVLRMRQYKCPSSEQVWVSDDVSSVWFIPDNSGRRSTCGEWLAYQHETVGIWWCNEHNRQLYYPVAA